MQNTKVLVKNEPFILLKKESNPFSYGLLAELFAIFPLSKVFVLCHLLLHYHPLMSACLF